MAIRTIREPDTYLSAVEQERLRPDGTVWTQATEHETPRAAIDAAMGEPS